MGFPARKRQRLITIQRRSAGQDAAGQPLLTWEDVAANVWAQPAGDNGLTTMRSTGDLSVPVKRYSFRIRYREGLDEGMRVLHRGQAYDIKAVRMDLDAGEWTDLVCELGANDG